MGKWDGRYEHTHEGQGTLEDDIIATGEGRFCYPTGTIRQSDDGIDVHGPSDSPRGHSHV